MPSRRKRSLLCEYRPAIGAALLGLVLSSAGLARAQSMAVADEKPRRVSLSYFGEAAIHPGLRLAYEGTPWARGTNQLLMGASIGGYSLAPGYSLFIFLEVGYRLALRSGFFLDLHLGVGYNALNRPGSDQPTADGGTIQTAPTVGNYFMPVGLAGVGYDFQPRLKIPFSLFVRGGGYGLTGQGEPFAGNYLLDAGLAYQFGTTKPAPPVSPVPSPPPAEAPANLESQRDPNRVPLIIPPEGQPPMPPGQPLGGQPLQAQPVESPPPLGAPPSLYPPGSGPAPLPAVPSLPPPPTVPPSP